jgi:non-specific serine/threonine protein kinase
MHELTITPEGHLRVRETAGETSDREPSKRLLEAYGESQARGMLHSATEEIDAVLPPPFEFARSLARHYLTNLCHAAIADPSGPIPELPPPSADLEHAVLQAPPMTGLSLSSRIGGATWIHSSEARSRAIPTVRKATSASGTRNGGTSVG